MPAEHGFIHYLQEFTHLGNIKLDYEVVEIDSSDKILRFGNGKTRTYGRLISSMLLPELISVLNDVPSEIRNAAKQLACTK